MYAFSISTNRWQVLAFAKRETCLPKCMRACKTSPLVRVGSPFRKNSMVSFEAILPVSVTPLPWCVNKAHCELEWSNRPEDSATMHPTCCIMRPANRDCTLRPGKGDALQAAVPCDPVPERALRCTLTLELAPCTLVSATRRVRYNAHCTPHPRTLGERCTGTYDDYDALLAHTERVRLAPAPAPGAPCDRRERYTGSTTTCFWHKPSGCNWQLRLSSAQTFGMKGWDGMM